MKYLSKHFEAIVEAANRQALPLILKTILELSRDFSKQFPQYTAIRCSTGNIGFDTSEAKHAAITKKAWAHPLCLLLYELAKNEVIQYRPDLTLLPAILINGQPIAEAIEDTLQRTFVVLRSKGTAHDYSRETLYCGTDYDTARDIATTPQHFEDLHPNADIRHDLEIWAGGRCLDVEEYAPEDFDPTRLP